jgi:CspA family cold shock protein
MTSIKSHPVLTDRDKCKKGIVRWFSERLGYGFIDVDNNEVFIQRSTLTQFGATRLLSDDRVLVTIETSTRGLIVETLLGIERMAIDESLIASHPDADEHPAYVKFFNEVRGYGFIEVEGYDQDIFVHSRVVERNGLSTIYDNQRLLVTVEQGEKGYQIKTIRLLVADNTNDLSPEHLTDMSSTDQAIVSSDNEAGDNETGENIQAASDMPKTDAEPDTRIDKKIDAETVPDIDTPHD